MAEGDKELGGAQKTAVLLLALGEQFASEVFKRMDRQELAAVSKAMMDLEKLNH